jgi:hypothetical protein
LLHSFPTRRSSDLAIRKGEKLDEQNSDEAKEPPKKPEVSISWKQFKALKK